MNFFTKILYSNIIIVLIRVRYYGGWKLCQAGITATGISFEKIDAATGKPLWTRIQNCNPFSVE